MLPGWSAMRSLLTEDDIWAMLLKKEQELVELNEEEIMAGCLCMELLGSRDQSWAGKAQDRTVVAEQEEGEIKETRSERV